MVGRTARGAALEWALKIAAVLTSRVMEAMGRLPGVPTLDWCDRAAASIARLHAPSVALCMMGHADQRGFLTRVDLVGVGVVRADAPDADTSDRSKIVDPSNTGSDRGPSAEQLKLVTDNVHLGEWIGWNIGALHENSWFVSSASQQGLLPGRGSSLLRSRWDWLKPSEIVLGAVVARGGAEGRTVFIEVAWADTSPHGCEHEQAALAAILPKLSRRVSKAFGPGSEDRLAWLTPREEQVLWQLVAGKKVPEIAKELHRSVYTVHDHVKSLHRKLNASNRGQLVARALGHLGPLEAGGAEPA